MDFLRASANVCRIGGGRLGDVLFPRLARRGALDLNEQALGAQGGASVAELLKGGAVLTRSSLARSCWFSSR